MSLTEFDVAPSGRAEDRFREAFERLKGGKPQHLPRGSKISQNNVAKEAGVDPSALRKSRFPQIIEEIQRWIDEHGSGGRDSDQKLLAGRARNRDLRQQLAEMRAQRDDALSKLVDAESHLLNLMLENERLQALVPPSNISPIRPAHRK